MSKPRPAEVQEAVLSGNKKALSCMSKAGAKKRKKKKEAEKKELQKKEKEEEKRLLRLRNFWLRYAILNSYHRRDPPEED